MLEHFKRINIILYLITILLMSPVFASVTASTDTATIHLKSSEQQPANSELQIEDLESLPQTTAFDGQSQHLAKLQASTEDTTAIQLKNETDTDEIRVLKEKLESLKLQKAITSARSFIQNEKYKNKLLELQQEKDKLELLNELQAERIRHELLQLQADKEKLLLENELQAAKQIQLLADLEAIKTRLVLENERYEQEKKKLLAKLEIEKEQLALRNAIAEEKQRREGLKLQMDMANFGVEATKVELTRSKLSLEVEELTQKIHVRRQKEVWESQVNRPKEYLKNPFVDDHLVISDRKIELDLVIFWGTAKYVNDRIHYYNNMSTEYPIFLIIDTCFGGSVTEGAKILEAINSSRAPVYVVVKTLAASMAAVITTLAKHSYAYPNALVIHHQIFTFVFGNQREIAEKMKTIDEWTKRILHPVAEKMGISMDEFVQRMYKNNSLGDWLEFADAATKLKWVNTIVKDMRDTSFIRYPTPKTDKEERYLMAKAAIHNEKIDSQGQGYVELPRLNPLDIYFLYNPNNYYRYR